MTKATTKDILAYIERNNKHNLLGNNSGVLAVALHREFDIDKFVFVQDPKDNIIYHVAVELGNVMYDGTGITDTNKLRWMVKQDFASQVEIEVSAIKASYGMYSYILKNTNPTLDFNDLA